MATRVGRYVWEIDPDKMPMDELKALKEYLDDKIETREFWLNRMHDLIDEAEKAGFQFTMFSPYALTNLTTLRQNINVKVKEKWV